MEKKGTVRKPTHIPTHPHRLATLRLAYVHTNSHVPVWQGQQSKNMGEKRTEKGRKKKGQRPTQTETCLGRFPEKASPKEKQSDPKARSGLMRESVLARPGSDQKPRKPETPRIGGHEEFPAPAPWRI